MQQPRFQVIARVVWALVTTCAGLNGFAQPPPDLDPVVYKLEGQAREHFGGSFALLGDVDGDGVKDFAASRRLLVESRVQEGRIDLFSGKDGRILRTWNSVDEGIEGLGIDGLSALPDLDGDGVPELGMGSDWSGVHVFSPVTGKRWYTMTAFTEKAPDDGPGYVFVRMPDLDGDGIEEFAGGRTLVGFNDEERYSGRVTLFSGRTGSSLWVRWGPYRDAALGAPLLLSGDHNGDAYPDILTTQELPRGQGIGQRPQELDSVVRVVSGRTGELLETHAAPSAYHFAFGSDIKSLGDWDGNGFPEVAISAPYYRDGPIPFKGAVDEDGRFRGWVGVYKLPSFELLYSMVGRDAKIFTFQGDNLGLPIAVAGDADGDGVTDLLAAAPRISPLDNYPFGRLYLFSGKDGSVLQVYAALQDLDYTFFEYLSPLGDVDGDGRDEFLVRHPQESFLFEDESFGRIDSGSITVLRYEPNAPRFIRGDVTSDGRVNMADAIGILRYALEAHCFPGDPVRDPQPGCLAAHDIDADGCIDRDDGIRLLRYLFDFYYSPDPPFPDCGSFIRLKPTTGYRDLGCQSQGACGGD